MLEIWGVHGPFSPPGYAYAEESSLGERRAKKRHSNEQSNLL